MPSLFRSRNMYSYKIYTYAVIRLVFIVYIYVSVCKKYIKSRKIVRILTSGIALCKLGSIQSTHPG